MVSAEFVNKLNGVEQDETPNISIYVSPIVKFPKLVFVGGYSDHSNKSKSPKTLKVELNTLKENKNRKA